MSSRPPLSSLILATASRERITIGKGGTVFVAEFGGIRRPMQDCRCGDRRPGGNRSARKEDATGQRHRAVSSRDLLAGRRTAVRTAKRKWSAAPVDPQGPPPSGTARHIGPNAPSWWL